ncbi:Hypothetical protein ORPV_1132 [Orpheovirus IHUMI-LCC2]|uniref:Uncharacterized protein n=1 Tax=Orpheovirus IHUMI-LCC2 TaxID=2023057 RepID=A0A2I2L697_9VIRU|nr:Hypothetical protein ORPV_1132 [Orpheovirus IHUMI-LCC2]SNW63036.1 Hypothetical protein ORPV_1132 [Orpheovirus IHUMI-LCC2]
MDKEYLELQQDLSIISKIREGETFCTIDKSVISHGSIHSLWKRTFRESRYKTCDFLSNIIRNAINYCIDKKYRWEEIKDLAFHCKDGLSNLKSTYKGDIKTSNNIDTIIKLIDEFKCHYQDNDKYRIKQSQKIESHFGPVKAFMKAYKPRIPEVCNSPMLSINSNYL